METLIDIIDRAKSRNGIPSDSRLALQLGIDKTMLTRYRKKHAWPGETVAMDLADLAGIPAARVLAIIQAEKAESDRARRTWYDLAANLVMVIAVAGIMGSIDGHSLGAYHQDSVTSNDGPDIHYATLGLVHLVTAMVLYLLYSMGFRAACP